MRTAIIGSRNIKLNDLSSLFEYMPEGTTEIVSGGAKGADSIAALAAEQLGLPIRVFLPNYGRFKRAAPLIRNEEIVQYADYVLALWDGTSRGTANVIKTCIREHTPVRVLICRDGVLSLSELSR